MIALPESIARLIGGEEYTLDGIGLSGSSVLLFSDKVLKIQPLCPGARQSASILGWLQGKLPVPRLLAYAEEDGNAYLLMSRIPGEMACTDRYLSSPERMTALLAQGLKQLWEVDIQDCPVDQRLDRKLKAARYQVEHGLVDLDNVQPDTFGPGGFRDPEALLRWLEENRPEEEPVLSHGDFCLPNIFFDGDVFSGYIDLDRCGVADKWCDIALCCRSLRNNCNGSYGGPCYQGMDEGVLFQALGIAPDEEKLRYYILLDELF